MLPKQITNELWNDHLTEGRIIPPGKHQFKYRVALKLQLVLFAWEGEGLTCELKLHGKAIHKLRRQLVEANEQLEITVNNPTGHDVDLVFSVMFQTNKQGFRAILPIKPTHVFYIHSRNSIPPGVTLNLTEQVERPMYLYFLTLEPYRKNDFLINRVCIGNYNIFETNEPAKGSMVEEIPINRIILPRESFMIEVENVRLGHSEFHATVWGASL